MNRYTAIVGCIVLIGLLGLLAQAAYRASTFEENLKLIQFSFAFFGPVVAFFFGSQVSGLALERQVLKNDEVVKQSEALRLAAAEVLVAARQSEEGGGGTNLRDTMQKLESKLLIE